MASSFPNSTLYIASAVHSFIGPQLAHTQHTYKLQLTAAGLAVCWQTVLMAESVNRLDINVALLDPQHGV